MRPPEEERRLRGHELHKELQEIQRKVGDAGYARATARLFAKGGKYNARPRRARYAIT